VGTSIKGGRMLLTFAGDGLNYGHGDAARRQRRHRGRGACHADCDERRDGPTHLKGGVHDPAATTQARLSACTEATQRASGG
jgi:hypothetical protein